MSATSHGLNSLTKADLEAFARIQVSAELLLEAGIRRVTDREARDAGILRSGDLQGILFPYMLSTGEIVGHRLRRGHPEVDRNGKTKAKYLSSYNDKRHFYVLPSDRAFLPNTEIPVVMVEAEKSKLAITAISRMACRPLFAIGLGGCYGWSGKIGIATREDGTRVDVKGPLPDFDHINWNGRQVLICFDTNVAFNPSVRAAERGLQWELTKRGAYVRLVRIAQGQGINGPDDYIAAHGSDKFFRILDQAIEHPEVGDEWPKPESLESELPPVEQFNEDLLPVSFRPLVADVTERMQVPMDYAAVVSGLCLAGAVNRRARIQPKQNDTTWVVVPNLWGGIIAPPGFMKSPVIQAVTRPLNRIQNEWWHEYEQALKDHAREKEEYDLRRAAWKEQYKSAAKNKRPAPDWQEDEPELPKLRRLIVNDATFEALHQTMNENPAGVLVIRDELPGWWTQLDRQGREGERAFSLQAWNGDTSYTIDRIGRGSIHVDACCMSMLGSIQPGRLRSYLVDALEDGPSNDGLIQRFQLLVWPDTTDWTYVDRAPDVTSEQQAERVFRKLVELDAAKPTLFRFAPDAQLLFVDWLAELEAKIRCTELHPALISHLSKYRKLMPALALLFALADWAAGISAADAVSLKHAQQAASWCDYLESHARRIYSCVVTPEIRSAQELAGKIKSRRVGANGFFTCRDVYQNGWSGLDSPKAVKQAVEVLQEAGWVRDVFGESGPAGGRPTNRYAVNPRIWE